MIDNSNNAPIKVKHADLTRASADSPFKSKCPACPTGLLLVYRDPKTWELEAVDRCVSCGQLFIYDDIDCLRLTTPTPPSRLPN
jgi:hypothetical protein